MRKYLLFIILLGLGCGLISVQAKGQKTQPAGGASSARTSPAQGTQASARGETPAQRPPAQGQNSRQGTQASAQAETPVQSPSAQGQTPAQSAQTPVPGEAPGQQTPVQVQNSEQGPQTSVQGQSPAQQAPTQASQTPAQGQPSASQRQATAERPAQPASSTRTPAQTSTQAKTKSAGDAVLVLDVNPFMWIFSGIPDENNNRSVFFDIGVQYNLRDDIALRFNPSFSFGFTSETAFTDSPVNFLEFEFPFTFLCFPFPKDTYLSPAFFGISVICTYHNTMYEDSDNTVFMSVGAMMELGYQFMFSNHLTITPSIGISRMFPKSVNGGTASVPNFNLYSPWTADTPISPRVRVTLGFWL
jgi:hypothetical protein